MRKMKKTLAALAIVGMVLTTLPAQLFAADATTRLADADRVGTSIAIANNGWTTADTVIVAPADDANLVDALAVAPLAGQANAPILMTYKDALDSRVQAEITALKAKNVYAVGALSPAAVAQLSAISGVTVTSLQGTDRFDTAAKIAAKLTSPKGTFVVGYNGVADAMSAASFAAANGYAILIADLDGKLPANEATVGTTVYTLGGPTLVADIAGATRLYGANRYATNDAVLAKLTYKYDKVYVANGESLVDALAGSALAAKTGSAIVLTDGVNATAAANVSKNMTSASQTIAFGGAGVVPETVRAGVAYQVPAVLSVTSVSAINAEQIIVNFNKDLTTLEQVAALDITNYSVYNNGSTTAISDADWATPLLSGTKSVILTLTGAGTTKSLSNNVSNLKVVIEKLAFAGTADKVFENISLVDVTRPAIESVTLTAPTSLKVKFTEPVFANTGVITRTLTASGFQVDSGAVTVVAVASNLAAATAYKEVTLTLSGTLADGNHTVSLNPTGVAAADTILDGAGWTASTSAFTYNKVADVTAPTVTVKSATQTQVVLQFSEAVANTADPNVKYYHTASGYASYEMTAGAFNAVDNTLTLTYTAGAPLAAGNVPIYIVYTNAAGNVIQDNFANKLVVPSLTAVVAVDTTKPTVTAAMASGSNTVIEVTVSEVVTNGATAANYVLKNSAGTVVPLVAGPTLKAGTTSVYQLTYAPLAGAYTLTVSGLADGALTPNVMATAVLNITVGDTILPFVTLENGTTPGTSVFSQADAKHVRIYFSEAMNTTDLNTLTNYQNAADTFANPTAAQAAADGKSVYLTFANNVVTGQGVVIGQLRDAAGNKMQSLATALATLTPASTFGLDANVTNNVVAVNDTTIKIYLADALSTIAASDFQIDNDGAGAGAYAAAASVSLDNTTGKSVVTLTLASPLNKATWNTVNGAPLVRTTGGIAAVNSKNAYGVATNVAATAAVDQVVPVLAATTPIATFDADADGKIDHIKVTFTENVAAGTVSANLFTVAGYTVTDAYAGAAPTNATTRGVIADAATVYVRVTEGTSVDNTAAPAVTIANGIKDVAGNAFTFATTATTPLTGATGAAGTFAVTTQGVTAVLQVAERQVTAGAVTAGGNITVDGVAVAVALNDTAAQVATKVAAATLTNWTVAVKAGTTDVLQFTAKVGAPNADVTFVDTGSTGVTMGAQTNTTNGVANVDEVATFTITAGAKAAGTLAVTVNGVVTYVTLAATDDTTAEVATAIATALGTPYLGYTVAPSGATVTLTQAGAQADLTGSIN
ncbi:MAG: cell wall-binding repeat-containing protein [Desulfitobacteriaceae bacterium]|nr:cell wall-binding repeat-containing protein [Desulfitobacteriaceae bacterium]MDI6878252.1 cell wall-binding repeat-containing protein [Desulfitobacteriaceae bacterium]MDI6913830.1 cell wall-binding repeat-containing protein [Desulfitobacteriaceae bacterium]